MMRAATTMTTRKENAGMILSKEEMEKLIEKYQKRADEAAANYQDTGYSRYYNTKNRNEDMVDSLRMAIDARDEHQELVSLRAKVAEYARKAAEATGRFTSNAERAELSMKLAKDLAEYGRLNGYIEKE